MRNCTIKAFGLLLGAAGLAAERSKTVQTQISKSRTLVDDLKILSRNDFAHNFQSSVRQSGSLEMRKSSNRIQCSASAGPW